MDMAPDPMTITIAKSFVDDLLALADQLAPKLRRAFLDAIAALRDELTPTTIADLLQGAHPTAIELWQRLQELLTPPMQDAILAGVVEVGGLTGEQFPPSVQIQFAFDRTNPFALDAVDTIVADAVRDIANASQDAIRLILRQGFTDGLTPDQMGRRLRANIGLTDRYAQAVENYRQSLLDQDTSVGRADALADAYARRLLNIRASAIARTESIRAMSAGQDALWASAVEQKLLDPQRTRRDWIVTEDDRLCPICEAIPDQNPDGVALGEPFQSDVGPLQYPPAHPLCFPGDTLVASRYGIAAQSKRWYQGQLVIIRTAGGKQLSTTPNHPILTSCGWMAASTLDESCDVICDLFAQRVSTIDDNDGLMPTSIEEVADTLWQASQMRTVEMPIAAEDFHGDGKGSQIAIVRAHSLLGDSADSLRFEPSSDFDFIPGLLTEALDFQGSDTQRFQCAPTTTGCTMGGDCLPASLICSHMRPLEPLGITLGSHGNAVLPQDTVNDISADLLSYGAMVGRYPSEILSDKIIRDERRDFSGHVYNLQTGGGWYIAEGIIAHNCRCAVTLSFKESS